MSKSAIEITPEPTPEPEPTPTPTPESSVDKKLIMSDVTYVSTDKEYNPAMNIYQFLKMLLFFGIIGLILFLLVRTIYVYSKNKQTILYISLLFIIMLIYVLIINIYN
tara:strand:+ start:82 stop:405 length:324 start_codon:yes stop_codon:yes gene_type:complete